MLSRMKYDQIADIIDMYKGQPNSAQEIARGLAGLFAHFDDKFDRQRFLDICDVADHEEIHPH